MFLLLEYSGVRIYYIALNVLIELLQKMYTSFLLLFGRSSVLGAHRLFGLERGSGRE